MAANRASAQQGLTRMLGLEFQLDRIDYTAPNFVHADMSPKEFEAAMAKLYATEAAQKIIDMAVQLHGGDGVRHGVVVESLYREIRALRIYEGASDVQRVIIARNALG